MNDKIDPNNPQKYSWSIGGWTLEVQAFDIPPVQYNRVPEGGRYFNFNMFGPNCHIPTAREIPIQFLLPLADLVYRMIGIEPRGVGGGSVRLPEMRPQVLSETDALTRLRSDWIDRALVAMDKLKTYSLVWHKNGPNSVTGELMTGTLESEEVKAGVVEFGAVSFWRVDTIGDQDSGLTSGSEAGFDLAIIAATEKVVEICERRANDAAKRLGA